MKRLILLTFMSIVLSAPLSASLKEDQVNLPKNIWNKIFEDGNFSQNELLKIRCVDKNFCKIIDTALVQQKKLSVKFHLSYLEGKDAEKIKKFFPGISKLTLLIDGDTSDPQEDIQNYVNAKKFPHISEIIFQLSSKICFFHDRTLSDHDCNCDHQKCWQLRDENYFMLSAWRSSLAILSLAFPQNMNVSIKLVKKMCSTNALIEEDLETDKKVANYLSWFGIIQMVYLENGDTFIKINKKYSEEELSEILSNFSNESVE